MDTKKFVYVIDSQSLDVSRKVVFEYLSDAMAFVDAVYPYLIDESKDDPYWMIKKIPVFSCFAD